MRLQVIGPMRVVGEAGDIRIPGPRPMALLAMLVLAPGGTVARATLIDRFWGDRPETQAAGSLRQTLYALRQTLGDQGRRIGGAAGSVAFDLTGVEVDLGMLRQGQAPRERLIAWSRHEVLEGVTLSAPGVEDWLRAVRDEGRDLVAQQLRRAAAGAFATGDWAGARDLAQALQGMDPYCEQAMRLMLRLDAQRGDLAGAQRRLASFARSLRADLGVAPSAELAALVQGGARGAAMAGPGPAPAERAARIFWRAPEEQAQWGLAATARTVVIEELSRAGIRVFLAEPGDGALPAPFLVRGEIVSLGSDQTVLLELQSPAREIVFVGRVGLRWPMGLQAFEAQVAERARALGAVLTGTAARPWAPGKAAGLAAIAALPQPDETLGLAETRTWDEAPAAPVRQTPDPAPTWQDQPHLTKVAGPEHAQAPLPDLAGAAEDRFWFNAPETVEPGIATPRGEVEPARFGLADPFLPQGIAPDGTALQLAADWHRLDTLDLPKLDLTLSPTEPADLARDAGFDPDTDAGATSVQSDPLSGMATLDLGVQGEAREGGLFDGSPALSTSVLDFAA